MTSVNNEHFCFFLLNLYFFFLFFLSLSYFTALVRTSRMMLNKVKLVNIFVLFLILKGKSFNF